MSIHVYFVLLSKEKYMMGSHATWTEAHAIGSAFSLAGVLSMVVFKNTFSTKILMYIVCLLRQHNKRCDRKTSREKKNMHIFKS